jgi:hypothetical protein
MAEQPPIKAHFARNGDVLYEVEVDLGEGRRGVAKWRQPWPRLEYIGLFEKREAGGHSTERPIPHGQRGAFKPQRERARVAVMRESIWHPWRRFLRKASPCDVHPSDVRCLSDRHALPLPAGLRQPKAAKGKLRPSQARKRSKGAAT